MGEKFQCNICNLLLDPKEIEDHIKTQNHQNAKNDYIQQLSSKKIEGLINPSSYNEWKKNQK
jgi:hypothetical protein